MKLSQREWEDMILISAGWTPGKEDGGVLVRHRRGYWSERAAVIRRILTR